MFQTKNVPSAVGSTTEIIMRFHFAVATCLAKTCIETWMRRFSMSSLQSSILLNIKSFSEFRKKNKQKEAKKQPTFEFLIVLWLNWILLTSSLIKQPWQLLITIYRHTLTLLLFCGIALQEAAPKTFKLISSMLL